MTQLLLDLPHEIHERLQARAAQAGKPSPVLAVEMLSALLNPPASLTYEREQVRAALQAAGLLGSLGPEMLARAQQADMSLAEIQTALDTSDGQPLSEIILEMRGPKA
jgi:hypothetical protein